MPKVGYVVLDTGCVPGSSPSGYRGAFYEGLRDLGRAPGQNIAVDVRCYVTPEQLHDVLREVVGQKVDVIFVASPAAARAARDATMIPIVCASCGDPVASGLAASLARPGGTVTGLASQSDGIDGKRVELLKETVPGLSRLAVLLTDQPGPRVDWSKFDIPGRALGIKIQGLELRNAGDLETMFRTAATNRAGAILIPPTPLTYPLRTQIVELAMRYRLPSMAGRVDDVEAGGLLAYAPDRIDMWRRAAWYVHRILKGATPADLPFEQPTKYDLVINLKTAKALGLAIPPLLLLRATRIVQ